MKSPVILVLSSLRAASGFIGFTRFDAPETDGFDVTLNDLQRHAQMQRSFLVFFSSGIARFTWEFIPPRLWTPHQFFFWSSFLFVFVE